MKTKVNPTAQSPLLTTTIHSTWTIEQRRSVGVVIKVFAQIVVYLLFRIFFFFSQILFFWKLQYYFLHDKVFTFELGREQFCLAAKKSEKQLTEVGRDVDFSFPFQGVVRLVPFICRAPRQKKNENGLLVFICSHTR